jgi:hypothetical protein
VELTRGLSLGTIVGDPLVALIHVAALLGFIVVGSVVTVHTIRRRLVRG